MPSEKIQTPVEWGMLLLKDGWVPRLTVVAREILLYASISATDGVVCLSLEKIRAELGRTKTPFMKALAELTAFGLVKRLQDDEAEQMGLQHVAHGKKSVDFILLLAVPRQLSDNEKLVLDDPTCRKALLDVATGVKITSSHMEAVNKRTLAVKSSGMRADILWSGIYGRLLNVLKDKQVFPRAKITLWQGLEYISPTDEEMNQVFSLQHAGGTTLNNDDWKALSTHEKRVVEAWESFTGKKFLRSEIQLVGEALRHCFPVQVISGIRNHAERADTFEYLMPMIRNGAFGRRRKSSKGGETHAKAAGRALSQDGWKRERERLADLAGRK